MSKVLTREQIVEEIKKGTKLGQELFEVEYEYYKELIKDAN